VGVSTSQIGEPDAGNLPVRFDERGVTRHSSTLPSILIGSGGLVQVVDRK